MFVKYQHTWWHFHSITMYYWEFAVMCSGKFPVMRGAPNARSWETNFKLKCIEIFASSSIPLTLAKFFHTVICQGLPGLRWQPGNIARVEVTEKFNISPAIHFSACPGSQNVNNYTIFDGMPRYYRVNYLKQYDYYLIMKRLSMWTEIYFLRPISNIKIFVTKSNQYIHIYYMNMYSLVKQTCL